MKSLIATRVSPARASLHDQRHFLARLDDDAEAMRSGVDSTGV